MKFINIVDPYPTKNKPIKIALFYFIISFLWIFFSDQLVETFFPDTDSITSLQTIKGIFFITITSIVIYFLIHNDIANLVTQKSILKNIIDTSPIGIVMVNPDGAITFANNEAESVLGLKKSDIQSRTYNAPEWKITSIDGSPFPDEELPFSKVKKFERQFMNIEHAIEYPDKRRVLLSINASPIFDKKNLFEGMVASIDNITEKKSAEETLIMKNEQLINTLESMSDGFVSFDNKMNYTYVNKNAGKLLGRIPEDLIGKNYWIEYPEAKGTPFAIAYSKALETQNPIIFEDYYSPWEKWFENKIYPSEKGLSIFFQDITGRKSIEEEIKKNNRELEIINSVIQKTTESINLNYRLQYIMDAALDIVGLEGGTICLINPDDTFDLAVHREASQNTIDDLSNHKIKIGDCLCGNCAKDCKPLILNTRDEIFEFATREVLRDEDFLFHAAFPFIVENRCVGVICVFTRTEKKPSVYELKLLETIVAQTAILIHNASLYDRILESEERFRRLAENARDLIYRMSLPDGRYEYVSPASLSLFGYKPDEFYNNPILIQKIIHPDWHSYFEVQWANLIKGEMPPTYEYQIITKSGEVRWVNQRNILIRNEDGTSIAIEGIVTDITERKHAEVALRKNQQLLQSLLDFAPSVIYFKDIEGKFITINKRFEILFHMDRYECRGKTDFDYFPKEIAQKFREVDLEVINSGKPIDAEEIAPLPDGLHTYISNKFPLIDENGKIYAVCGISTDITDRKKAEDNLVESEKRYRTLFENMTSGFVLFEVVKEENGNPIDLTILAANNGFEKTTGLKIQDAIGKNLTKVLPGIEKDSADWIGTYGNVALTGISKQFEQESELLGVYYSINAFQAGPKQCAVTFNDISERRRAEEALRQSNQRLKKVLEVETVGVMFWDLTTGSLVDANDTFLNTMGYNRQDVEERVLTWQKLTPPEYYDVSMAEIRKFQISGRVGPYEKEYLRKDGTKRWFVFAGSSLGNNQCVEFCVDISEQKLAEEKLKSTHEQYRQALNQIKAVPYLRYYDLDNYSYLGEEILNYTGYSDAEFKPSHWKSLRQEVTMLGECSGLTIEQAGIDIREGRINQWLADYKIITKNGEVKWINDTAVQIKNEQGKIIGSLGVLQDITERKRIEEEIKNSREELRNLTHYLQTVREEERAAIAREIHDELGQVLTSLKMNLVLMQREFSVPKTKIKSDQVINEISSMTKIIDASVFRLRKLISRLRPEILDKLGLVPALQWYANEINESTKIKIIFASNVEEISSSPEVDISIFRILQESLTNIIKHSQATVVRVNVEKKENELSLSIKDNGIGFDEENAAEQKTFGLIGMKERAILIGAELNVSSKPGKGTEIKLTVKL